MFEEIGRNNRECVPNQSNSYCNTTTYSKTSDNSFIDQIDPQETHKFLKALGVKEGDAVYYQVFKVPEGVKIKLQCRYLYPQLPVSEMQEAAIKGCGFGLRVNKGGTTKEDITGCRAFFTETDADLTVDEQIEAIANLPIKPNILVDTGNRSVHAYFIPSDGLMPVSNWEITQKNLKDVYTYTLKKTHPDKAGSKADHVTDLSRVMRLPGSIHPVTGKVVRVLEVNQPTLESSKMILALADRAAKIPDEFETDLIHDVRLNNVVSFNRTHTRVDSGIVEFNCNKTFIKFLEKVDREKFLFELVSSSSREIIKNIYEGNEIDDRSRALTTICNEFLGWQNWLKEHGIRFDLRIEEIWRSLAEIILSDDPDRIDRIWNSIDKFDVARPAIEEHKDFNYSVWSIIRIAANLTDSILTKDLKGLTLQDYVLDNFELVFKKPKDDFLMIQGKIFHFDGRSWKHIDDESFSRDIYKFLDNIYDFTISSDSKKGLSINCKKVVDDPRKLPSVVNHVKSLLHVSRFSGGSTSYKASVALHDRLPLSKSHIPALNLANGILLLQGTSEEKVKLIPHDRDYGFTHCSNVNYDPDADITQAEELLKCIPDSAKKQMFLDAIAMMIDIKTYRGKKGRPKALVLVGTGSNGKDALRACCKPFLGKLGKVTLDDYKDQAVNNKKFALADVGDFMVNWSSENTENVNFSKLKFLISSISGESYEADRKHKEKLEVQPNCGFIFHANREFVLDGNDKFLTSRLAFIDFPLTFSSEKVLKPGELRADPRFHSDEEFIVNQVSPGLLRLVIDAYKRIWTEGEQINWGICDSAFDEIVEKFNHIVTFVKDNVIEDPDLESYVFVSDLWNRYKQWVCERGWCKWDMTGSINNILLRPGTYNEHDQPCLTDKAFGIRIKKFFPNWKKGTATENGKKGRAIYKGIRLIETSMSDDEQNF